MDITTPTVSPLRQRMVEDMRMRKFEPKTQSAYLRAVRKLAAFLKAAPDTATAEDLRRFQLQLVDEGASPITLNATISGLKFFFDVTLSRGELMAKMQPVSVPRTLPVVLSRVEVSRLIAAAWNLKHQTALAVAYGTGLRASEVIALKVGDIDSQHDSARRARQGSQGPLCHAAADPAAAAARVVARGPCPGQDFAQRLAVPGPGSHRPAEHAPAQPRHPRRRRRSQDRQARLDAHAAPLFRVREYAERCRRYANDQRHRRRRMVVELGIFRRFTGS